MTLSVINWRISRGRLAPTANRMAISLRRSVARARRRFARFTQARSRTRAPTPPRTAVKAKTPFRMSGINRPGGINSIPRPAFSLGYSFPSSTARPRSEASAWDLVIPGFNRPTTKLLSSLRRSIQLLPGSTTGPIIMGTQNSGA